MQPLNLQLRESRYDPGGHYENKLGPVHEFGEAPECSAVIHSVGWTLGNDCPYKCQHCYSISARRKGMDLSKTIIDRVIDQLRKHQIETVNLGGNEPLFTNGLDASKTLLPYIIERLHEAGIKVGLTSSGTTLVYLYKHHRSTFYLLNDVDVSLDSPFKEEHNRNRQADLYPLAIQALQICQKENIPHTIILTAMNWNFSHRHIEMLVELATVLDANVRVNPFKPLEPEHLCVALNAEQYYAGFSLLMSLCDSTDLGEPPLAAATDYQNAHRCPCGRTSFRIHSITPDGHIPVSPCVYLHDYKAPLDLQVDDLDLIIHSPQFRVFRQRNQNPHLINGCAGCSLTEKCGGGCAARAYLHHVHQTGSLSFVQKDPFCPKDYLSGNYIFPQKPALVVDQKLVHIDYLCTWIGRPKP